MDISAPASKRGARGVPRLVEGAEPEAAAGSVRSSYEGGRVLRFSPAGKRPRTVLLPVRCASMPGFGGPDRRTLFITTAREKRPAHELAALPWSGRVLQCRVDVPGLPATLARSS